MPKVYYVFYKMAGGKGWSLYTSIYGINAQDAIDRCYNGLEKVSNGSGKYRAFKNNRLPWEGR